MGFQHLKSRTVEAKGRPALHGALSLWAGFAASP
jgi:hypothetical protein